MVFILGCEVWGWRIRVVGEVINFTGIGRVRYVVGSGVG